jgi:peptidoglycan LD-endopeptidase CwlK
MPELSARSEKNLRTCHPDLQRVIRQVARDEAIEVLWGHRDKAAQDVAFKSGVSKTPWPHSKHNPLPSEAVDVVPLPIDWGNIAAFVRLSAKIKAVAAELGVRLRWGADWDSDGKTERGEWDYPHWELVQRRRVVMPRPPIPGATE